MSPEMAGPIWGPFPLLLWPLAREQGLFVVPSRWEGPTTNAKEVEVERFYDDLQDLLELTPPKDVLFITEDLNAKYEVKRYLE